MRHRRLGKKGRSKAEQHHQDQVRELGCIVTGSGSDVTIHHVHGGSISERLAELGLDPTKGLGMRGHSEWLVIPLTLTLHSLGPTAIDGSMGVKSWETVYGRQADMVDRVGHLLGYSLWKKHADSLGIPLATSCTASKRNSITSSGENKSCPPRFPRIFRP